MALLCLADSTDLRLFIPPRRTYNLTLQDPVLSNLLFESSPVTLLDGVQSLLGQKARGRYRCTLQTALRHLRNFRLEVSPEFLRIFVIVTFAETFRNFLFVHLGVAVVRGRRTSSRIRLNGTILRDLSRIFGGATRVLWSVQGTSALRKNLQLWTSPHRLSVCT